ncbi:MAG: glycogen synthase GlgA [Acidobacteriota bacterium]|jgi:starch synthase|nr:glycogen synthase GlgA [Acidobacteriota bacterium]
MDDAKGLRIVMVAAEAAPYAKVGGLGDVVGALPRALEKLGARVAVVIPAYGDATAGAHPAAPCREVPGFDVTLGGVTEPAGIFHAVMPESGVDVYRVASRRYFARAGVYDDPATREGYPDNMERFVFFMKAAVGLVARLTPPFDVIHCHDSHAGLVPGVILENYDRVPALARARTVFTIHNLAYQGVFPREALALAGIAPRRFYPGSPFEFWGKVNFMKAGIALAHAVTTVSPTYAEEVQTPEMGVGLDGVLRERKADLHGIINGIDYGEWNPVSDPLIPARFSALRMEGKAACKKDLLESFGLGATAKRIPLVGMVSRLADQKGFDLVAEAMPRLARLDMQLVVLGTGQQKYHDMLRDIAARYPDRVAVHLGFDNALAHRVEAGCDLFLMPSRYEPCGLNQLYSLRYGTIPVVHRTGGLADTVVPYDGERGTGFSFPDYTADALLRALQDALHAYSDVAAWKRLVRRAMTRNWSWDASARRYLAVYRKGCDEGAAW